MADLLTRLEATVAGRRGAAADSSYVASLQARGMQHIARKLGEEAIETIVAAMAGDAEQTTREAADLLFHLVVLLDQANVPLAAVYAELERREGTSGLVEKAARAPARKPEPAAAPPPAPPPPREATAATPPPAEPILSTGGAEPARPRIRRG